jgi:FKBP-type peptidyl-prolyl cis-trans isomerase
MTQTRKRTRVIALAIAVLFFAFSCATTIALVWQSQTNKSHTDNTTSTAQTTTSEGTKLENFTPVAHIDQLQSIDTTVGTGAEVKSGDTVTVDYTGAVAATGVVFQSSKDSGKPVTFPLDQVIKGWTDGIPGMKVGGTRRLLIPAASAYGANPPSGSGIPANADLVFDVTLHAIGGGN